MSQTDRVQTSVYFPKEVYAALVKWAEEEDRSVSNLVVRLVTKAIEEKESKWSGQLGKSAGMMPKLTIDKTPEWYLLDRCSILRKRGKAGNEELDLAVMESMVQDSGDTSALE